MTSRIPRRRSALAALAAALLVGGAARGAPEPVRPLTRKQESMILRGMTMDEVTAAVGKPQKVRKYGKGEATWGYMTAERDVWLLVDFGSDGKVKLTKRQVIPAY